MVQPVAANYVNQKNGETKHDISLACLHTFHGTGLTSSKNHPSPSTIPGKKNTPARQSQRYTKLNASCVYLPSCKARLAYQLLVTNMHFPALRSSALLSGDEEIELPPPRVDNSPA
jgi:hypothetical protein